METYMYTILYGLCKQTFQREEWNNEIHWSWLEDHAYYNLS